MSTRTNTAWAFLVVSDPGQADTLTDQEAWTHEAAAAHHWTILKTISGVSSGKLGARKLTLGMIEELEALPATQRPERLLMIRLERLGRGNGLEAMEAFLRIRRLGITVHTRLDGDVGYDRASELLMPVLRFFIGGMENEVRRDKLNAMYERRRAAQRDDPSIAISSKLPYGLAYAHGHMVPKPPEDAIVKLAYDLKSQGYGAHVIAKRLVPVAPPMTLKDGTPCPQRWTADRVRRLLIKPCYRGIIVDEATWHRAQQPIREVRRPTLRYEYPLGGALRCWCGYALIGNKGSGKKSSTFRYYQCTNSAIHGGYKHYRSNVLEEQFVALLERLRASDELLEQLLRAGAAKDTPSASVVPRLTSAKAELGRIEARRRAVFVAYEDGDLPQHDLRWRLNDLDATQGELEAQIRHLTALLSRAKANERTIAGARRLVERASTLWQDAAIDDKRALAKAVATAFGGLVVSADSELIVGQPETVAVRSPKRLVPPTQRTALAAPPPAPAKMARPMKGSV